MPSQFHPAYTMQWTLSVQRDLSHGWQAQVDYIGNRTVHDPMGTPLSPAALHPGVWGAGGTGCAGIVTTGPAAVKPGAAGTNCSTTKNQNSRFALTIANAAQGNQIIGGGAGSVIVNDVGFASYNGMWPPSSTGFRRPSACCELYLVEVPGHSPTARRYCGGPYQNPNNPRETGAVRFRLSRHREFVIVARSNFRDLPRAERLLIDNWEFAPLVHITTGAAVNVTSGVDNSLTDEGQDRPKSGGWSESLCRSEILPGPVASEPGVS